MSSCQDFLMPAAEGGVAVGMEPMFPTASFIKLEEAADGKREKLYKHEINLDLV